MKKKLKLMDIIKSNIYIDEINDVKYEVVDLQKFVSILSNEMDLEINILDISCFFTKFKRNEQKENIDVNMLLEEIENVNFQNKENVDYHITQATNELKNKSISLEKSNKEKENGISSNILTSPNITSSSSNIDIFALINDHLIKNMLTLKEFVSPIKSNYITEQRDSKKFTFLPLTIFGTFIKEKLNLYQDFVFNRNFMITVTEMLNNGEEMVVNLTSLDKHINKIAKGKGDTGNRPVSKYQK